MEHSPPSSLRRIDNKDEDADEFYSDEKRSSIASQSSSIIKDAEISAAKEKFWDEKKQKITIGCVIVIFLAVSWVGTQQFAQNAVQLASFNAPYFTTWMGTCWMTLCFPAYTIFIGLKFRNRAEISMSFRDAARMFKTPEISKTQFFLKIVPLNMLWLATNYLYISSLKYIAATDASAIFASNVAFVYMLALCILHERLYAIRIFACVFCIAGVALFAYADGFVGGSGILGGTMMTVISAFGAALYKVIFKSWLGTANLGQVSLFLSLLGVSNAVFMWIVFLILYFTGVEYFEADDIPWSDLTTSNFLSLVFNFAVNFGVAYTYPLFISIAMMLGIPLNAVVDIFVKGVTFSPTRLAAAFLVILGFCVMLFPDHWNYPIHDAFLCKCQNCKTSIEKEHAETNNGRGYTNHKITEEKV
uniref:putative thiamine transporter SLC35F3 n=1 Tax=Styela clava TaxID=7725 RepID=UPI0019396DFB|nr:putative thiamine transporter SLC35F3 [Styela clava]